MTIHSSKGLEFPVVFILGFTEGIFPSSKTIESRKNEGLEEERRLCYVAMTRAEKHLFLMDSEGMSPNGIKKLCSRFLEEIGESNYVRIGTISEELKRESRGYAAKLNMELEPDGIKGICYQAGDRVSHHIFGEGTIQTIDANRGSYLVQFDSIPQPRNISKSYFLKTHEDARKKVYGEQVEEAVSVPPDIEQQEKDKNYSEKSVMDGMKRNVSEAALEDMSGQVEWYHVQDDGEAFVEKVLSETDFEEENENRILDFTEKKSEELLPDMMENLESGPKRSTDNVKKLKNLKENSPNLWKCADVPHTGWNCVGVDDLGAPVGICEMCGYQIIRYAHHMEHPQYRSLVCGCVCAGKMEGDIEGAKRREADFKNKQSRRVNFFKRKWKRSKKGNDYLKIDNHVIVIYNIKGKDTWRYSIDNDFCKNDYQTRERALAAAFDALEELRK